MYPVLKQHKGYSGTELEIAGRGQMKQPEPHRPLQDSAPHHLECVCFSKPDLRCSRLHIRRFLFYICDGLFSSHFFHGLHLTDVNFRGFYCFLDW
ncbi:hypothetical protein AVEN_19960-1 [Araneus ventricosus]|uniref:Uncharacterized protein n=1 Tax=Araneus ventricosus TaxID=182803 RepID=A0A4Y2LKN1_ARAVE|nr:hypothetical protein AVEN_19960-1 [Araneus ventricosus]